MSHPPVPRPRVGLVSFAHYHANFWSEALNGDDAAELAGIWDDDPARGEEAAARYGTRYFRAMDDLLGECDAVGICSETSRHADHIGAAADAGCDVLCEKPIAESVGTALRIRDVVQASAVRYMQSFPKRFDPVSHELERIVGAGELGRIHLVRVRHGHYYGLDPDFRKQWYVDPALAGGGALLDEGVHAADLLCWLFGVPRSVVAMVSAATAGLEVEDTGLAVFEYESGLLAEIVSSWVYRAAEASIEIYGDGGTAIVSGVDLASRDLTSGGYLKVFHEAKKEQGWQVSDLVPRFQVGGHHHQNMLNFTACLREGREPPVGLDDGIRALALIEAAYAAAASGERQAIDIEERLT